MKKTYCLALLIFFSYEGIAQSKAKHDTIRYQKLNTTFIVAFFQSYRNFKNEFQQFKIPDSTGISKNNYNAEARLVTGFEFTYDKFCLSVGFRTAPSTQSAGKGFTKTFNTNLNFGGNIWYLQNTYRYFSGFYDNNTSAYDTTVKQTGNYYQRPDMQNVLFRSKFLYFTHHHKYAFRAGYSGNYRQLRSAATWILSANINYYNLQSDSSFFAPPARPFYNDYASLHGLRVFGLSANAGAAGTLVIFKSLFINGMFIIGPEQQWRKYTYDDKSSPLSYVSISGDLRFSVGINLSRFYFMVTNTNDFAMYNSSYIGLSSSSISGGFTLGWRFYSEVPEFYKKFQKTKFYNSI